MYLLSIIGASETNPSLTQGMHTPKQRTDIKTNTCKYHNMKVLQWSAADGITEKGENH